MKINKDYTSKIISLVLAGSLLLNTTVYGVDLSSEAYLRPQMLSSNKEGRHRLDEAITEVSEKINLIDYPELKKIWDEAKSRSKFYNIQPDDIEKMRKTHMRLIKVRNFMWIPFHIPLFFFAYAILWKYQPSIRALAALILPYKIVLQSALVIFLDRIIPRRTKEARIIYFLRQPNYKIFFEQTPMAIETTKKLQQVGVNENWDNPEYSHIYQIKGKTVQPILEQIEYLSLTQQALKRFLGYQDEQGIACYGELTDTLNKGRKSIRKILKDYQDFIELVKNGKASRDNCLYLLNEIKTRFIKPTSKGEDLLKDIIETIAEGRTLLKGQVKVSVWKRDPWTDLSSSKEFNCCAFLGGVNELAAFYYLTNKSISMLDFSTVDKGRIVRAIIGAGTYKDQEGRDRSILLVDSVEGTLSLDPKVIKKAIEDYAATCGFDAVLYNNKLYGVVPEKFVQYVIKTRARKEKIKVELADHKYAEYLESFTRILGGSFKIPVGKVKGYFVPIEEREVLEDKTKKEPEPQTLNSKFIEIVQVRPEDWKSIKDGILTVEEVFPEGIRQDEEDLSKTFEDTDSITIVLKHENSIIGYIAGGPLEDYSYLKGIKEDDNYGKKNTIYIESFAVLGDFQSQGLGHKLRDKFLSIAGEKGYKFVTGHIKKGIATKRGDEVLSEFTNWLGTGETFEYYRSRIPGRQNVKKRHSQSERFRVILYKMITLYRCI